MALEVSAGSHFVVKSGKEATGQSALSDPQKHQWDMSEATHDVSSGAAEKHDDAKLRTKRRSSVSPDLLKRVMPFEKAAGQAIAKSRDKDLNQDEKAQSALQALTYPTSGVGVEADQEQSKQLANLKESLTARPSLMQEHQQFMPKSSGSPCNTNYMTREIHQEHMSNNSPDTSNANATTPERQEHMPGSSARLSNANTMSPEILSEVKAFSKELGRQQVWLLPSMIFVDLCVVGLLLYAAFFQQNDELVGENQSAAVMQASTVGAAIQSCHAVHPLWPRMATITCICLVFVQAAVWVQFCLDSTRLSLSGHLAAYVCAILLLRSGLFVAGYFVQVLIYIMADISGDDIDVITGPRHVWSDTTTESLIQKYGESRIKIADATNRRLGHILFHFGLQALAVPFFMAPLPDQMMLAEFIITMCVVIAKSLMIGWRSKISSMLFHGVRIRDGYLGRINLMVVFFVEVAFLPLYIFLIIRAGIKTTAVPYLIAFVQQPLVWGDTMAEVVGSFFGRLEFPVYGFGEVNRKTVEGCLGCFVASLISCWFVTKLDGFQEDLFTVSSFQLVVIVALTATVAETWTPRGMDNGTILLSSTLTTLWLCKSSHD